MPNRKKPELQRKTHNMKIRLDDIQYSTIQLLAEEITSLPILRSWTN